MKKIRGTSLIEVMVASSVLIIGLTGITQLVLYGMAAFRTATVQTGAQLESRAAVADFLMAPYGSLTEGTFDAGIAVDLDGRAYSRLVTVTSVGDGGVAARRVEVRTTWSDSAGRQRQAIAVGLISEIPDAN